MRRFRVSSLLAVLTFVMCSIVAQAQTYTPPTLSGNPPTTATIGSTYDFTPTITNPSGHALTLYAVNLPPWATFNSTTGEISGTVTAPAQTYGNIVIHLNDGTTYLDLAFQITVSTAYIPPTISGSPPTAVTAGSYYHFYATVIQGSNHWQSCSVENMPSWAQFNSVSCELYGTPSNNDAGVYQGITISDTDGVTKVSLAPFSITVTVPYVAPTISGTPAPVAPVGRFYSFTPTVTAMDGATLTFSATNLPAWATFNTSNGTLSGSPVTADIGVSQGIVISVTDGTTTKSLPAFTLTTTANISNITATSFAAGQSVTATGAGFGTKSQAGPLLFDNFEGGAQGAAVPGSPATIGSWNGNPTTTPYVTYSNVRAHSGHMSSQSDFFSSSGSSLLKTGSFPSLYMDFWVYIDDGSTGLTTRNWKTWWLWGNTEAEQMDNVWQCDGGGAVGVVDTGGSPQWVQSHWGNGVTVGGGRWMHVQLAYKQSTPNVADGSIHYYVDSAVMGVDSDAVMTRTTDFTYDQIYIGSYWAHDAVDSCPANPGADVYVDDVYLDTSWARVEIGDQPTYAASTHREIQLPTAWSDGSITFTLNPGSFTPGTTVWVYVIDAKNRPSSGYPITITN